MPRNIYVLQVTWRLRKKVADWLDKGKGPWWLRPLQRTKLWKVRREVAAWPPPKRIKRKRFPTWVFQQGAWWLRPIWRTKLWKVRREVAVWPPPRRIKRKRYPTWLFQQGAWWLKPLIKRNQLRQRGFAVWPAPRRYPTRGHRFPAWLVQQGAYWWRHKRKPFPLPPPPPRRVPARRKSAAWASVAPAVNTTWTNHRRKARSFAAFPAQRKHRIKSASWLSPVVQSKPGRTWSGFIASVGGLMGRHGVS